MSLFVVADFNWWKLCQSETTISTLWKFNTFIRIRGISSVSTFPPSPGSAFPSGCLVYVRNETVDWCWWLCSSVVLAGWNGGAMKETIKLKVEFIHRSSACHQRHSQNCNNDETVRRTRTIARSVTTGEQRNSNSHSVSLTREPQTTVVLPLRLGPRLLLLLIFHHLTFSDWV